MARKPKPAPRRPKKGASRAAVKSDKTPNKRPTNLSLDPAAVARGEEFSRRHGTSLSQLVTGFLYSLPSDSAAMRLGELAPAVRRLYGVAAGESGATADRDAYRVHLDEKYGAR